MNILTCWLRLAIRYQLQSQGSRLTMEEIQILENKRTRLQKLIDTFAHQSDVFLLNHKSTEDTPMSLLGDYLEYDHADDIDESGVPGHSGDDQSGRSPMKDGLETNTEDFPILLPSSLGWSWCNKQGLTALADREAKLHYAQATDSVHRIRLALGFKAALFRTEVRHSRTQKTKTRAWAAVHCVDASVHEHARNYSMARDAYNNVIDPSVTSQKLRKLELAELRVETFVIGAGEVGQRNKQLPWIWSFGTSEKQDGSWMEDCGCLPVPDIWIKSH